ncbi:MAG: Cupin 2, conserved barrel domain protein [Polaromonas sp.]|nr:Cupin 2, conserved barrel domain protein [Polaromonas sp.]
MAIAHAAPGQLVDVHPLGNKLSESHNVALFKTNELEVIRLVMPAGKTMPSHWVKGEVMIHCLEGSVSLTAGGQTRQMSANQLVWLEGGVDHALTAVQDASLLLTIVLRKTVEKGGLPASTGGLTGN